MTKLMLSVHVLAAILAIGPIAVAASMFPRFARVPATQGTEIPKVREEDGEREERDDAPGEQEQPGQRGSGVPALLHRICRVYAVLGLTVPVFGIATGAQLGVLTDAWLIASLILTTGAAVILGVGVLPCQERLLERTGSAATSAGARQVATRLTALTGTFNLLWTIVVVLMIVRPGSTTSA